MIDSIPHSVDRKGRVSALTDSTVPGDGLAPGSTVHQDQSWAGFGLFDGSPLALSLPPP